MQFGTTGSDLGQTQASRRQEESAGGEASDQSREATDSEGGGQMIDEPNPQPEPTPSEVWEKHATAYADLGYPVMPCVPGDKPPLTANGLKDASTDEFQIGSWATGNPNANLAIVVPENVLVVDRDIDPATGKLTDWPQDEAKRLSLFAGSVATTPRGGMHHFFSMPSGQKSFNTVGKLAPQVDTRGGGGYVLVFPSVVKSKSYAWLDTNPLDCRPENLPVAPQWLLDALNDRKSVVVVSSGAPSDVVREGGRNDYIARSAGALRRHGFQEPEIFAALMVRSQNSCMPPLSEAEVRQIAHSVARYEPDQIQSLIIEGGNIQGLAANEPFSLNLLDSKAFARAKYEAHFLIKRILAAGQPGMIGGPSKCFKTTIAIDMAISLGTGTPFMGHFEVPNAVNVGVMSGESGLYTIQRNAKIIAETRGVNLEDAQCFWGDTLPQISKPTHVAALGDLIGRLDLKVCLIDPAYLCLLSGDTQKRNASNMFDMGPLLFELGKVGQSHSCAVVLIHHNRKNLVNPFALPELSDMSHSGFQEYARQWILLNRRSKHEKNTGKNDLWLVAGGSIGHNGAWAVDIDEGVLDDSMQGRKWIVSISTAGDAVQEVNESKAAARAAKSEEKIDHLAEAIIRALEAAPEGLTLSGVQRDIGGKNANNVKNALTRLRTSHRIEDCQVLGGNKQFYPGIKLSNVSAC